MDIGMHTTPRHKHALAGRLVPVFAGEDGLPQLELVMALAKAAAQSGESVLIIDCDAGDIMPALGITPKATLQDVIDDTASIADAKHITQDGRMSVAIAGLAPLESLLGALAAMSLAHDWVFILPSSGCTPAHVRLAAAADQSLLAFDSRADRFMRAYWMLDAIRTRAPKCDPLIVTRGPEPEAAIAYDLFAGTVREFLGAPPSLCGHIEDANISDETARGLLKSMQNDGLSRIAA